MDAAAEGMPLSRSVTKIMKTLTDPLCLGEALRREAIIHCLKQTFVRAIIGSEER